MCHLLTNSRRKHAKVRHTTQGRNRWHCHGPVPRWAAGMRPRLESWSGVGASAAPRLRGRLVRYLSGGFSSASFIGSFQHGRSRKCSSVQKPVPSGSASRSSSSSSSSLSGASPNVQRSVPAHAGTRYNHSQPPSIMWARRGARCQKPAGRTPLPSPPLPFPPLRRFCTRGRTYLRALDAAAHVHLEELDGLRRGAQIGDEMQVSRVALTCFVVTGGGEGCRGPRTREGGRMYRLELHRALVHEDSPRHNYEELLKLHRAVAVVVDGRNHSLHLRPEHAGWGSGLGPYSTGCVPWEGHGGMRGAGTGPPERMCVWARCEWVGQGVGPKLGWQHGREGRSQSGLAGRLACSFVAVDPIIRIVA